MRETDFGVVFSLGFSTLNFFARWILGGFSFWNFTEGNYWAVEGLPGRSGPTEVPSS